MGEEGDLMLLFFPMRENLILSPNPEGDRSSGVNVRQKGNLFKVRGKAFFPIFCGSPLAKRVS